MAGVIRKERYQRGPFGKLVKWTFIAFNVVMLLWFASYLATVSGMETHGKAEQVGAAIGITIGVSMLLMLWAMGDVVLGLFVLFTRGDKIITEETIGDGGRYEPSSPDKGWATDPDQIVARYVQQGLQAQSAAPPPITRVSGGFGKRHAH